MQFTVQGGVSGCTSEHVQALYAAALDCLEMPIPAGLPPLSLLAIQHRPASAPNGDTAGQPTARAGLDRNSYQQQQLQSFPADCSPPGLDAADASRADLDHSKLHAVQLRALLGLDGVSPGGRPERANSASADSLSSPETSLMHLARLLPDFADSGTGVDQIPLVSVSASEIQALVIQLTVSFSQ